MQEKDKLEISFELGEFVFSKSHFVQSWPARLAWYLSE